MLTFHNVVNLSSGPEVTQSDLVHFRRALKLTHTHTHVQVPTAGAPEQRIVGRVRVLFGGLVRLSSLV